MEVSGIVEVPVVSSLSPLSSCYGENQENMSSCSLAKT